MTHFLPVLISRLSNKSVTSGLQMNLLDGQSSSQFEQVFLRNLPMTIEFMLLFVSVKWTRSLKKPPPP